MFKNSAKSYAEIRGYLDTIPVIDTHEHYTGYSRYDSIKCFLGYLPKDMLSASFDAEEEQRIDRIAYSREPATDEDYQFLYEVYKRVDKTAYARGLRLGMKECWGIAEITPETFRLFEENYRKNHHEVFDKFAQRHNVKALIADMMRDDSGAYIDGHNQDYPEQCRFAFPLPHLHNIHDCDDIMKVAKYCGGGSITCLDDYLETIENYLKKAVDFGVVCMKDQSAYLRTLEYGNPPRSDAEKIFNSMLLNRRKIHGSDEHKPLGDWLFNHLMRLARKYSLPVQIHTGYLSGNRGSFVEEANAANLAKLLDMHRDVNFDLFHGNWPFMDEYLYIGKSFPNVYLDLCWAQCLDPLYCIEFMKRALMTIPHTKILAYGGDTLSIEMTTGYLIMAKDNVACALSELVESGWMDILQAKEIAADWFFNNPNRLFKLGFEPFVV